MKIPLVTSGCTIPLDKFWSSVMIFHGRPHILNKKITGVIQVCFYEVIQTNLEDILQYLTYSSIIYEVRKLPELNKDNLKHLISNLLVPYDNTLKLSNVEQNTFYTASSNIFISLRILIPRANRSKKCIEIAILNKRDNKITYYAISEQDTYAIAPNFPYHIEWVSSGQVRVAVDDFEVANSSSADWLVDKVFSKIIKWSTTDFVDKSQGSLSLISLEKYVAMYHILKEKYGKKMVEIWPEKTDPLKFVYEDVAIATYLICLWETIEPSKKPTFLDLGCGNGLLVYILAQEGYEGCGIDIRERRIWNIYPQNTKLLVKTIMPSSASLFPDTDWIIGNHSDELTPWIPVIALRSSYKANIFLLPCCCYDFSGKKYSRVSTSKSQYEEYLEYIRGICTKCGFTVKTDKLRIPSTKKTCIVSYGRSYKPEDFEIVDGEITQLIESRGCAIGKSEENWLENFTPRHNVEKVQNCTQLDRDLIHRIIMQVLGKLLEQDITVEGCDGKLWNRGGSLRFDGIISCIEKEDLKQLKHNSGGLQTLLRNHRYIFEVERGNVKIRVPQKYSETVKYKSKVCWFMKYHPGGCPNTSESCAYKHVDGLN